MKRFIFLFIFFSVKTFAIPGDETVKKSRSGVCHTSASQWFEKLKHYKTFVSLDSCLESGGRILKQTRSKTNSGKYNREDWEHWSDDDGDCINLRHELLTIKSLKPVEMNKSGCSVTKGVWIDKFSDNVFYRASDLDVDHIVSIYFAHKNGGAKWSREQKKVFANDTENLLIVHDVLNRQKGADSPADWLPPNHAFRCEYITKHMNIVKKYKLKYPPREKRIIQKLMMQC